MPVCKLGDLELFYEDIGVGDPVLFLHSAYSRGILAFGTQIQPFAADHRCLFPDFRGHGRTRSATGDWTMPQIGDDCAGLMRALGIPHAHLVGYSLGGGVALHMAAKYPEIVRTVTAIGCNGSADPTGVEEYEPEALIRDGKTAFIERMKALHAEASGGSWEHHMRQSAFNWRNYPDLSEADWDRITMPLLLIAGESDPFTSAASLEAVRERCPQTEIMMVPDSGHRPHFPMEHARDVNLRILDFMLRNG